jgi:hypothetical protein
MSIHDCISSILAAGGKSLEGATDDEIMEMADRVEKRAQWLMKDRGMSYRDGVTQAGKDIAARTEAVAAQARRAQLMNLQKRISRRAKIDETAARIGGKRGVDLVRAIRNTMVALNTPVRGGRLSAEAEGMTWHDLYLSGVTRELDRAGLFQAARSNAFQRQWGRELYELSMKDAGRDAHPGISGNKAAIGIANVIHKYMVMAKGNLNKEGAAIGDYSGYITRTVHDGDKMRRAGMDNWIATIGPLLDTERTFNGAAYPRTLLRSTFNSLVNGVHLSDEGGIGFSEPEMTGPANLAKKLAESRVLHFNFKDPDAWLDYQEKFGTGTLLEQVSGSLGRAAHAQALLSRWGTNPGAEFEADIRWAKEKYNDTHTGAVDQLGQAEVHLKQIFDTLTGESNRPAKRFWAKVGSYLRLNESMAKLGMVMFTHLSSIVTKAGELHYQGVPWMQAYGDFFAAPFRDMKSDEAASWADETLAGMEGTNRDILAAFSPNDAAPGTASRLANLFFKWSGLTWLLNKQKSGAEFTLSRRAGMSFDRAHDDLSPQMQRMLNLYDISPAEWDILRQAPRHAQIEGRMFLTPQAAIRAPDSAYEANLRVNGTIDPTTSPEALGRRVDDARQALMLKTHAWLHDTADRSVVTPGVEDRAMLVGSTRPGTIGGEFWRFIAQFKMWPIAALRQQWGREINGTPGETMGKVGGIMNLLVGSMITGYSIMTLKDLMKGQNPRNPVSPSTAVAAIMQGGGLGIAGDYLFGEYNRFGQNPLESAAGPVIGQGGTTLMDLWNRIMARWEGTESANMQRHPLSDLGPDALKLVTDNLPFVNLFYTRQALNYLFLYSLQETMRPGYLKRAERSLQKRTGTTMWMSPAENHLHTFGR